MPQGLCILPITFFFFLCILLDMSFVIFLTGIYAWWKLEKRFCRLPHKIDLRHARRPQNPTTTSSPSPNILRWEFALTVTHAIFELISIVQSSRYYWQIVLPLLEIPYILSDGHHHPFDPTSTGHGRGIFYRPEAFRRIIPSKRWSRHICKPSTIQSSPADTDCTRKAFQSDGLSSKHNKQQV